MAVPDFNPNIGRVDQTQGLSPSSSVPTNPQEGPSKDVSFNAKPSQLPADAKHCINQQNLAALSALKPFEKP